MERKSLQVWLPIELHEKLEEVANRERRSKGAQVAFMLERSIAELDRGAEGTQIAMPETDEDREAMLERLR